MDEGGWSGQGEPSQGQTELGHWKVWLRENLSRGQTALELGLLLMEGVQAFPGRLGHFIKDYKVLDVTAHGGVRFRDVLPLPVPSCQLWTSIKD